MHQEALALLQKGVILFQRKVYDGAVRAFATAPSEPATPDPIACDAPAAGGCCDAGGDPGSALALGALVLAELARRTRRRRRDAR